ncbi:MAG TPA: enoyl-CoA hydratase-related protein [Planctomycetota bacterium]|nr:enoyl-CoA hydratase-related protein [Planctomycetota bacterium]
MESVLVEETDRVLRVTLNAPERGNSVDRAMLSRLEEVLRGGSGARAVLLRGAGERSFCTGYNIEELVRELSEGPSVTDEASHPLEKALRALDECPVPTIALVHGNAYGAGCELACACDLRVAADDARFCMPPAKLGVLYSASGTRRLIELTGVAATKEMFFTAEPVSAERALALGLANRVVAKGGATEEAEKLARTIASNAPLSVRGAKEIVRRLRAPALDADSVRAIARLREECFRSRDFAAATQAFLTKTRVDFEGR